MHSNLQRNPICAPRTPAPPDEMLMDYLWSGVKWPERLWNLSRVKMEVISPTRRAPTGLRALRFVYRIISSPPPSRRTPPGSCGTLPVVLIYLKSGKRSRYRCHAAEPLLYLQCTRRTPRGSANVSQAARFIFFTKKLCQSGGGRQVSAEFSF